MTQSITYNIVFMKFTHMERHAYKMMKEYDTGTFNFTVDVALRATFPGVFKYSFDVTNQNILIDLNCTHYNVYVYDDMEENYN